jgi:hypothetical protein
VDHTEWLNGKKRTEAERQAFTKGAADDLNRIKQRREDQQRRQQQPRKPRPKRVHVDGHDRDGDHVRAYTRVINGTNPSRSKKRTTRRRRRPPTMRERVNSAIQPQGARANLQRAWGQKRRGNNGKAIGFACAAVVGLIIYLTVQITLFAFAAFAALLAAAAFVIEDMTE